MQKATDFTILVVTPVYNNRIRRAKKYLKNNYASKRGVTPHISFVIMPIPESNLKAAAKEVESYLRSIKPLTLRIKELVVEPEQRFFYLKTPSKELYKIHKNLVRLLNKHRDGYIRTKEIDRLQNNYYSIKEVDNIKKFGYARIFDQFQLHITLGEVEDESANLKEIERDLKSIVKKTIGKPIHVKAVEIVGKEKGIGQVRPNTILKEMVYLKDPQHGQGGTKSHRKHSTDRRSHSNQN